MLPAAPFQSLIDPEDIAGFAQNGSDRGNHAGLESAGFGFMKMVSPREQPGSTGSLSFDVLQRFGAVLATVTAMGFSIRKIASFASQVSSQVSSLAHSASSALGSKSSKPPGHQSHHGGLGGLKPRENTHARHSAKVHPVAMESVRHPVLHQQNSMPQEASVLQQSSHFQQPRANLPRSESPKMAYQQYQQPAVSAPPQRQAPSAPPPSTEAPAMHRPAPQGALGANAAQMAGLDKTPQHTVKEAVPQTLQQAESTLDMLTAKNSKLAERLHQLDDKIAGLEAKWTSKGIDRDTRAQVSAELDAATNKYVQLEKRYDVRQDQINLLKDEIKSLTPPPETRLDKLTARVDRLSPRIDNLLDQIHDLKAEYAQSTHPGDRAEIRAEIQGFEKELAQLDKRDKAARTEINFLTKPKTNVDVKTLMQLAEVKGPRESGGQGDIIRGNLQNLRNNGSLLNKRDELVATQRNVQKALAQGYFNGLPPAELKEMRNLANLNIDTKLDQLADVKQVVNNTSKQLKNMGAGGLFDAGPFGSIPTTAAQRRADAEAERAHIEELAAGGGMNV